MEYITKTFVIHYGILELSQCFLLLKIKVHTVHSTDDRNITIVLSTAGSIVIQIQLITILPTVLSTADSIFTWSYLLLIAILTTLLSTADSNITHCAIGC